MENDLKQKAISGLTWSFFDGFAFHGSNFVISIILARILSPKEFGLIGMLTIFIAISNSIIISGLSRALIRKNNCTQKDYSTVFFYNIVSGVILYFILFFLSGTISSFFSEPLLKPLMQVFGISLIFNSFGIVPETILIKKIEFRIQARVSLISSFFCGTIAIGMALYGFGVWSLVSFSVSRFVFRSLFLWIWSSWRPSWEFSKNSFRELFGYSYKLLFSSLLDITYRNIYYLIIGKFFSATELGYYSKAEQFGSLPSMYLNNLFSRVSFSVLSEVQGDKKRLRDIYGKLHRSMMLFTFTIMLGIAAVAKPLVLVLIGEKWMPAVIFIQLLCFAGIFFPLNSLNLNILLIHGRSDIYLFLEVVKKILVVPIIIAGINFGIKIMILGLIVNALIAFVLNSFFSNKFINYTFFDQLRYIFPSFMVAAVVSASMFAIVEFVHVSPLALLMISMLFGSVFSFILFELFKINDYIFIKENLIRKFKSRIFKNEDSELV
ncbi:MAG: lipopolysaccharide biosynthesis protein [Acidobacteriota bacterium]